MTTESDTIEPTTAHREQPDGVAASTLDGLAEDLRDVSCAYGANYERLAALKAKYDPANVFRMNHNIQPAGAR